jgi:hypothetical protein
MNVNTEIDIIIDLFNNNKLNHYKFNSYIDKKILLLELILKMSILIKNNKIKTYKLYHYYSLFNFIVINLNDLYNNINESPLLEDYSNNLSLDIINSGLLRSLTMLNRGNYLLKILNKKIFNKLSENNYTNLLITASEYGTYNNFLFWFNRLDKTILDLEGYVYNRIIIYSFINSDSRLYKFILTNILYKNKYFFDNNKHLIINIIKVLNITPIPDKYLLRRLKVLSSYINLIPYFDIMMASFKSLKILTEIHKYYYKIPHTWNSLLILFTNIIENNIDIINLLPLITKIQELLNNNIYLSLVNMINNFKTYQEKFISYIILLLKYNINININNEYRLQNINNEIQNNIINIILSLNYSSFLKNLDNYNINSIFKIIDKMKYTHYIEQYYSAHNIKEIKYLLYTKFINVDLNNVKNNIKCMIKANLILHNLRLYLKKYYNKKLINYNIKMHNILYEIKYFKPHKHIKVLKNGSKYYQLENEKFNYYKLEKNNLLDNITNNKLILKNNLNRIVINNLYINAYPYIDILFNYEIKANYDEDLDLYLIYDINIPNMTYEERYNILLNNYQYFNIDNYEYVYNIDNNNYITVFDNIQMNINKYNSYLTNFIEKNKNYLIKWFPQNIFILNFINNSHNEKQMFLNNILNYKNINNNFYNTNGLILSSLNNINQLIID